VNLGLRDAQAFAAHRAGRAASDAAICASASPSRAGHARGAARERHVGARLLGAINALFSNDAMAPDVCLRGPLLGLGGKLPEVARLCGGTRGGV
jgi:hypothetical protein